MAVKRMVEMTVKELRQTLRRTQTVLLPVGLCEQHGYHLPLGTDIINAEQFAWRIGERYPCVVAPTLNYSFSGGMLPGTINVHPHVITQLIDGIIQSLYHQGFRRVGVVMGHGGSEAADAIKESLRLSHWLNPDHKDLQVVYLPVWEFSPTWMDAFTQQDYHAGRVETSLLLYWCPEKVRSKIVLDRKDVAEAMRQDPDYYQQWSTDTDSPYETVHTGQRPEIEVGVMGFPHEADAALGKQVTEEVLKGVVRMLRSLDRQTRQGKRRRKRSPDVKMRLIKDKRSTS